MAFCFKIYGASYLQSLLEPLITSLLDQAEEQPELSFEVDPARDKRVCEPPELVVIVTHGHSRPRSHRLEAGQDIEINRSNLVELTQEVFNRIVSSADKFPPQLRSMCHCLYQGCADGEGSGVTKRERSVSRRNYRSLDAEQQRKTLFHVLSKRFAQFPQTSVGAVGTVLFLRFINPAIVSPQEMGIVNRPVPPRVKRGLMLMSKILQNIANHVEFSKEQHMLPFNDFLRGPL
ncbi:Neurofibromin [Eumeta japonica]|uniref:Neurofibromin n=1 Tax=Eumeta variegata TaxID=151549 RepID=A0A4C1ZLQ1_EUMVA|nr:Neurofibromin [Eumeta japonica]